ncbi:MAG: DUF1302 domain-containing protein, partial [Xanthomonadales bacterium]|nr:DUF1302 domain-containing protein [Xanthomonadales bacterium]
MTIQISSPRVRRSGLLRAPLALGVAAALLAPAAQAVQFESGSLSGSIDTTVSYGAAWRVEDRDDDLIGKANLNPLVALMTPDQQLAAPGRFSVNGDDGNLNYDKGDLISNAFKITSELSLRWNEWGAFARGTYFYDFENAGREDLTEQALEKVGSNGKLLDAFIYRNFSIADKPATIRLGRQVVSWGESTFIQGGINVINPVDVSALRVAGAELKEAFLPIDSLWASFALTDNLSVEGIYMFEFEQIEPDPTGAYFSTNDFAAAGGEYVMLNFGTVAQPVDNPENFYPVCYGGQATDLNHGAQGNAVAVQSGCLAAVPRAEDRYPDGDGQWGIAFRYYSEALNQTEFGFFYLNYDSRLPLISGKAITAADPRSGRYFVEYPEDIDLYGISFNTTLPGGWAWQGEVSYRPNMPLQFDDVELLFAALTPLNALLPQPGLRFQSQLGEYLPGQEIQGWERHEVTQAQFTLTKLFGPGNFLKADQIAVVGEFGATNVWDLPDPDVLRYQGDGTDTGGGADRFSGNLRNPITQVGGFPTKFSWGYRLAARADYNNAFGSPFTLSPRVAFNHDVNG